MEQVASESRVVLSTDELPDADRDAVVRDLYGRIAMRLDLTPADGEALRLQATTTVLPGVRVSRGTVAPMSWERTAGLMSDGNDDLAISWMAGGYHFERRGRAAVDTRPGAACIMPMDEAWRATTHGGAWTLCAQLPRAALQPLVRQLGDVPPDAIDPRTPGGRLLLDYLAAVGRMELTGPLAALASRHLAELVAHALGTVREEALEGGGGVAAARLRALKAYAGENLHRPTLSAEGAARALGISPRYIRKLFAGEGRTFSDYVAEARLDRAWRLLRDPRYRLAAIAEIAFECGWPEPSTFYRRFKARFAMSPSEARHLPG